MTKDSAKNSSEKLQQNSAPDRMLAPRVDTIHAAVAELNQSVKLQAMAKEAREKHANSAAVKFGHMMGQEVKARNKIIFETDYTDMLVGINADNKAAKIVNIDPLARVHTPHIVTEEVPSTTNVIPFMPKADLDGNSLLAEARRAVDNARINKDNHELAA